MLTKTKIALVAALVAGSATAASAQGFDPNPANRYPAYAGAGVSAPYIGVMQGSGSASTAPTFQSAPVALRDRRNAAPAFQSAPVRLAPSRGVQQDEIGIDLNDRASSPYAGGVN